MRLSGDLIVIKGTRFRVLLLGWVLSPLIGLLAWVAARGEGIDPPVPLIVAASVGIVVGVGLRIRQVRQGWLPKPAPAASRHRLAWIGAGLGVLLAKLLGVQVLVVVLGFSAGFLVPAALKPVLPERDPPRRSPL